MGRSSKAYELESAHNFFAHDYTDTDIVYSFYSFSIVEHSVARRVLGDLYIRSTRIALGGQHGEFGPRGAGSDELKLEALVETSSSEHISWL